MSRNGKVKQKPRSIISVCVRPNIKRMVQVEAERQRITASMWVGRLIEDALEQQRGVQP